MFRFGKNLDKFSAVFLSKRVIFLMDLILMNY